jgi:hypothetical protein
MSLCFCLLFGAVAMQPARNPRTQGGGDAPATEAAPADQSALNAESVLLAPDAVPLAGSPWAWLGVVTGAGVLGGTARWSWQIRSRKRTIKK